jgi:hypothetical protein
MTGDWRANYRLKAGVPVFKSKISSVYYVVMTFKSKICSVYADMNPVGREAIQRFYSIMASSAAA